MQKSDKCARVQGEYAENQTNVKKYGKYAENHTNVQTLMRNMHKIRQMCRN